MRVWRTWYEDRDSLELFSRIIATALASQCVQCVRFPPETSFILLRPE